MEDFYLTIDAGSGLEYNLNLSHFELLSAKVYFTKKYEIAHELDLYLHLS